jgi:hypothetical protein
MRAATMGARIIRNLSWLIIIAIFVAGSAAKGEERPPFLGGHGAIPCQEWSDLREAKQKNENIGTSKALLIFSLEDWALGFISGVSAGTEPGAREVEETYFARRMTLTSWNALTIFVRPIPLSSFFKPSHM